MTKSPETLQEFEQALDSGTLFVATNRGGWWKCRRNGKTKRWKNDPERFAIPFKAGFKSTGTITNSDIGGIPGLFTVCEEK